MMYEATPHTMRTLKDGTKVELVKPSQVGDRRRYFVYREDPDDLDGLDGWDNLHDVDVCDGDDDIYMCYVEVLPPPRTQPAAVLTTDKAARKAMPIARGVMDYFPLAVAEVARVSYVANEQHNPGQPMHWARGKSTDHADCIARHLIERGAIDDDGLRHSAKLAWRALALLQEELEAAQKEAA